MWPAGSVVVARGFSSCGTRAYLLCDMWDLPGPGLEPVSPALAGRSLTTVSPGKSLDFNFIFHWENKKSGIVMKGLIILKTFLGTLYNFTYIEEFTHCNVQCSNY